MKIIDDGTRTLNGLNPSPFDARDYKYNEVKSLETKVFPRRFMNRKYSTKNQGEVGSCGAFAYAINAEADAMCNGDFNILSPLFVYASYKNHFKETTEGVNLRDLLKIGVEYGICREDLCKYPTDKIDVDNAKRCIFKPISDEAKADALTRKLEAYATVKTLEEMYDAIITEHDCILGVTVTDSFLYPQNGVIGELCGRLGGLHAVTAYGWDLDEVVTYDYSKLFYGDKITKTYTGVIYVENQWGEEWGDKGMLKIPIELFDANVYVDFKIRLFNEVWSPISRKTLNYNPNYHIDKQPTVIKLTIGSDIITVNGVKSKMDCKPVIQNSRILVPVRAISENLGATVEWNDKTNTATITL